MRGSIIKIKSNSLQSKTTAEWSMFDLVDIADCDGGEDDIPEQI